jgi:hypothetical protein
LRDPDGNHGDKNKEQRDHVDHRELIGALQLAKHPDSSDHQGESPERSKRCVPWRGAYQARERALGERTKTVHGTLMSGTDLCGEPSKLGEVSRALVHLALPALRVNTEQFAQVSL